jgi:hypothetical protein
MRVISSSGASLLPACLGAGGASAQTTEASGDKVEEVVVTGYREDLEVSLGACRR